TKRKPFTLKEQQEYLIESLPGIGALLSKSLLQKFSSPVNILNSAESQLKETSGIGKKKAKAIRQVLDSPYT
ncbi:MAG TPA: helix-hairpin-helix domain-containing protein, partial [Candidatus Nanoarchaeia archaeon]|nr:helix-hairpin-helix domain-containing protein [Candidatus Nanoarchaeia archaeon]